MPKKELRITINYNLIKGLQTSPFIQFQSAVALSQSCKALENPTCYQTLETKASSKKTEVNSVSCVAKSFLHALPVGINCIFTCNLERTYQIRNGSEDETIQKYFRAYVNTYQFLYCRSIAHSCIYRKINISRLYMMLKDLRTSLHIEKVPHKFKQKWAKVFSTSRQIFALLPSFPQLYCRCKQRHHQQNSNA